VRGRLDDEKLETLRSWGTGLSADGRDELRAAGKAILILIEEIEQLQVDVWHASKDDGLGSHATESSTGATSDQDGTPPGLDSTLRSRLGRLLPARSPDGA
jgi:hypothetical protein